jgi:actin-related protein
VTQQVGVQEDETGTKSDTGQTKAGNGAQTASQTSKHRDDSFIFDIMNPHSDVEITSPLKHGIVEDWDMMESVLDYHLKNSLQVDTKEYPFVLVEPALQPRKHREKWAQLLFEKEQVCVELL